MTDLGVTEQGLTALGKARGWAHYLAFLCMVGACLMGLAMAVTLVAMSGRLGPPASAPAQALTTALMAGMAISLGVVAVVLRGYWKGAAAFLRGEPAGLVQLAARMRFFLVVTVVSYTFMNVLSLVIVVAQLFGHDLMGTAPPQSPGE